MPLTMGRHANLAVVALTCLPLLVATTHQYDMKLYHTCLTFDGTSGLCSRWQMYGRLKFDAWGCFPPDAKLIGEHGPISMAEVSIGDKVLAYDDKTGLPSFSTIRGWLHRNPLRTMFMVDVHMKDGSRFTASRGHLVAISCRALQEPTNSSGSRAKPSSKCSGSSGVRYVRASSLEAGDALVSANKTAGVIVDKVTTREVEGLYSPFTWQSNFFVLTSENGASKSESAVHPQAVLAHSFTDLDNPQMYETAWNLLLSGLETLWPSVHSMQESLSDGAYVHPIMRVFRRVFGEAPVEDIVFKRILAKSDEEVVVESYDEEDTEGRRLRSGSSSNDASADSRLTMLSIMQTAHLPPFLARSQAVKPDPAMQSFERDEISGDVDDDDDDDENWDLHYSWIWWLLGLCFCISLLFFVIAMMDHQSKPARAPTVTPSNPPYPEANEPEYPLAQNPDGPYDYYADNMPEYPGEDYYNNAGGYPPRPMYGPSPPPPSYYY